MMKSFIMNESELAQLLDLLLWEEPSTCNEEFKHQRLKRF